MPATPAAAAAGRGGGVRAGFAVDEVALKDRHDMRDAFRADLPEILLQKAVAGGG